MCFLARSQSLYRRIILFAITLEEPREYDTVVGDILCPRDRVWRCPHVFGLLHTHTHVTARDTHITRAAPLFLSQTFLSLFTSTRLLRSLSLLSKTVRPRAAAPRPAGALCAHTYPDILIIHRPVEPRPHIEPRPHVEPRPHSGVAVKRHAVSCDDRPAREALVGAPRGSPGPNSTRAATPLSLT